MVPIIAPPTDEPSKPVEKGADFTVWLIKPTTPIPANQSRYMRFRFRIVGLGRTWYWGNYDAIFNFRVCDIREAAGVTNLNARKDRIQSIERIYLFLVAPTELEPVVINPKLQYARLFEGENWEGYLRRKVRFTLWCWKKPKLSIYQWTNAPTEPGAQPTANPVAVSKDSPFRAYAQLRCWPPKLPNRWMLLIILVVAIVLYPEIAFLIKELREWIEEEVGHVWNLVAALGVVALLKWLFGVLCKIPKVAEVYRALFD